MKRRKVFIITMVVFAGLLSTFSFYFYQVIRSPNFQVDRQSFTFLIPRNATFRSVQDTLYKYKVVTDMVSFSFLAKLMNYQEAVKPGLYTIEPNMTNIQAVRLLRADQQLTFTTRDDGRITVVLPPLDHYEMVVFQYRDV